VNGQSFGTPLIHVATRVLPQKGIDLRRDRINAPHGVPLNPFARPGSSIWVRQARTITGRRYSKAIDSCRYVC